MLGRKEDTALLQEHFHGINFDDHVGKGVSWSRIAKNSLLPALFFTTIMALLVFKWRFEHRVIVFCVKIGLEVLVLGTAAYLAFQCWMNKGKLGWPLYFLLALLVADFEANQWGEWTWKKLMGPAYDYENLQTYGNINPSNSTGKRFGDAGVMYFSQGTSMDRSSAGCFVNDQTYCIAPIVRTDSGILDLASNSSQDFFAVGVDCCDCPVVNFRCGAWADPFASSGLRQVDNADLAYYLLAAQKWSAAFNRPTVNPLFFHFASDPVVLERSFMKRGIQTFFWCSFCAVVLFIFAASTLDLITTCLPKSQRPPRAAKPAVPRYV
mmetsp:Transcript_21520/g.47303  ORF Transcript_21520/g.47303 Transcript_21520/m.47303 type:complete len:323 (+) Transcript_21520:174-1142(+)